MRPIDADELRKKLLIMEFTEDIIEIIDSTPTAYNIDKVVEELEGLATNLVFANQSVPNLVHSYDTPTIIKAIEIVRNGGVKNE